MRSRHTAPFIPYPDEKPERGDYGLFLRQKGQKCQIGGPNYYNCGGTQFGIDHFVYD